MTKIIVAVFLTVSFLSTGCAVSRKGSDRGMLSSLRKINDELNQKVQHLENEIRALKLAGDADESKAESIKEYEALKKKYNDAVNSGQGNDQKVRQLKEDNDRMEIELIDVKNQVMALKRKMATLTPWWQNYQSKLRRLPRLKQPPSKSRS